MILQVLAAGSNAHGQLANGTQDDSHALQYCEFACEDNSLRHQLPGDRVVSVASGANHTLLLLESNSVSNERQTQLWGCGDNRHGQLGPGHIDTSTDLRMTSVFRRIDPNILDAVMREDTYTIIAIAASWESSYVVLRPRQGSDQSRRDTILSMGNNDFQDLGVDTSSSKPPAKTFHGPYRVALEPALEAYTLTGFQVFSIAAGPHQVIAAIRIFSDEGEEDVLVGWGACRHGQLGTNLKPTTKSQATTLPRIVFPALTSCDVARDTVASFALGSQHTILLHRSGRVTGLGSDKNGQLNGLRIETSATSVHCTWNGTYIVSETHSEPRGWEIKAAGSSDKGQLGHTPILSATVSVHFPFDHTTHRLAGIACGSEHVLALVETVDQSGLSEGGTTEVWGWGWNEHGNLGLGHTNDAHLPTKIWPRDRETNKFNGILGIWGGCGTSWIAIAR